MDGILIPTIRFADNIVLLAEIKHDIQRALVEMQMTIIEYQTRINSSKTKKLVCAREPTFNTNIYLGNHLTVQASSF